MELGNSPTPPAVGPARLIISLTDSAGVPVEGARVVVEGNMSHAGMVPVVDTALAEDPALGYRDAAEVQLLLEQLGPG